MIKPLILATGEALVTYAQAAALLGTTVTTLKGHWLATGWLNPTRFRHGKRRFLLLEEVERAGRERARLTNSRLLTAAEAARYLGVKPGSLRSLISKGRLREARPRSGLFAQGDLEAAFLHHIKGIPDPVTRTEAARLSGRDKNSVKRWIAAGRLVGVKVGQHWYCSRAAALKLRAERRRLKAKIELQLRKGQLLQIADAAKLLGVSYDAVNRALLHGVLKPVRVPQLRRLLVRAADLRRATVRRQIREPFRFGLPEKLLDSTQVAALQGTTRRHVNDMARDGRLRVAARCRSDKRGPRVRARGGHADAASEEDLALRARLSASRSHPRMCASSSAPWITSRSSRQWCPPLPRLHPPCVPPGRP